MALTLKTTCRKSWISYRRDHIAVIEIKFVTKYPINLDTNPLNCFFIIFLDIQPIQLNNLQINL